MSTDQVPPTQGVCQRDLCAILLVTLLGFALRILFTNGPLGGDDTNYFAAASEILERGYIDSLHHHFGRLVLLLLVGIPGAALDSFYVSCLVNILWSMAADLAAVLLAWRLLGSRAALFCAIVLLLNGLTMSYSGTILPEPLVTLFAFLATWAFQGAIDGGQGKVVSMAFAAGVLAGLAYSVKDTGILVAPLLLLYLAVFYLRRRPFRVLFTIGAACVAGFVLAALLESLTLWLLTGDFAYRYHAISQTHNSVLPPALDFVDFVRRGWWNFSMVLDQPLALGLPILTFFGAWCFCLFRRPALRIFAFVGLGLVLYSLFGTSSFTRLMNLPFQERYATLFFPFGAICLAACVASLLGRPRTGTAATALIVAGSLWAGLAVASPRAGTLYFTENLRNAVLAIDSVPEGQVAAPEFLCTQLRRVGPVRMKKRLECLPHEATLVPEGLEILVLPTHGLMADLDQFSGSERLLDGAGWVRHSVHEAGQRNIDRLLGIGERRATTGVVIYVRRNVAVSVP